MAFRGALYIAAMYIYNQSCAAVHKKLWKLREIVEIIRIYVVRDPYKNPLYRLTREVRRRGDGVCVFMYLRAMELAFARLPYYIYILFVLV